MKGVLFATGRCYGCGVFFAFDPELVPSIHVDPSTGLPPDIEPKAGGYDRATRQPLCEACVLAVNLGRRSAGRELIDVPAGAYPFED